MQLFEHGLSRDALRRLIVSFILRDQQKRAKQGLVQSDQALAPMIFGKRTAEIDAIEVTEETLGFDSLGTLELILGLNRFFDLNQSGVEDYLLIKRRIGDWINLLSQHRQIVGDAWAFGFATSGSTGDARVVPHLAETLWSEMRSQVAGPFSEISAPGRIVLLVPPHHIYGFLFGCVLPDILGIEVIDLHRNGPSAAFRHTRSGDLVVGTPYNWDMLQKIDRQFVDGVYGVTSAGPSSATTWDSVARGNLARLTEVYGSTETGGIATRSGFAEPFELLPHLEMSDKRVLRRIDGEPLPLQDRLEWISPNRFHLRGRLDHVVQVAGVNVSPQHIRDRILCVDGVADAAVRMGATRLKAFVVPKTGMDTADLQHRLQAHVFSTLEATARPESLTFGDHLPRNEMGKAADWS